MKDRSFILLVALGFVGLSGCATLGKKKPVAAPGPQATDSVTVSKKAPITGGEDDPVYVLPVLTRAWVNPSGDEKQWRSGYSTATVVQPPHWATREEAEQNGRQYIVPGDSAPTTPVPGSSDGGELNATTVAQKLATIGEVDRSAPANDLPARAPSVLSQTPPGGSMTPPKVSYSTKTDELYIFPGGADGATLSTQTPLGPALLIYTDGKVTVTFRGKSVVVDQPRGNQPTRVKLE